MQATDKLREFYAAANSGEAIRNRGAGYLSHALLEDAVRARATDVHIDPRRDGAVVRFRIDGAVLDAGLLDADLYARLVNQIKTENNIDPGVVFLPRGSRQSYEVGAKVIDVRLMLAPCCGGQKIALRLLDPERVRHRVEDLGLGSKGLQEVRGWLSELTGMFLVTGPTGSGKTTTLYALLHELAGHERNIVTVEDPVEYEIEGINQIQIDRRHGLDFAAGVRAILRMDPDYIMVGEMRSAESAVSAAGAALAGHVLLSTIHARNSVSAVTSLRNYGLSNHQIAAMLSVVVNQRLIRKTCEHCRVRTEFRPEDRVWLDAANVGSDIDHQWTAEGCDHCDGTGYFGRTGIFETWRLDETDYELLLAGADERTLRDRLAQRGAESLLENALRKVNAGITTLAEVKSAGCR